MDAPTISTAVSVCAAAIAVSQVYVARATAHGQLVNSTLEQLGSEDFAATRALLYKIGDKPVAEWSDEEAAPGFAAILRLNQLGFLNKNRYVSGRPLLDFWAIRFVRLYGILQPLMADRRAKFNSEDQGIYFEWLSRYAYRHLTKKRRKLWWQRQSWRRLQLATAQLDEMRRPQPPDHDASGC